ncbi:MAG: AI-2E family transporter, partial [Nitrospira sp.]|nr:AI-2E family transporter [Nitrospira sp.]
MSEQQSPYEEGKRAGLHPLAVMLGVLAGLWLFVALIVPSSRNKQATGTEGPAISSIEDPDAAPVI